MTFPQRVVNSIVALALSKVRDLFVYEKLEEVIDQQFPDEPRSSRPSLDELEHNAGLALQVKNLATNSFLRCHFLYWVAKCSAIYYPPVFS